MMFIKFNDYELYIITLSHSFISGLGHVAISLFYYLLSDDMAAGYRTACVRKILVSEAKRILSEKDETFLSDSK